MSGMGIMQVGPQVLLPNNPFVPPRGGVNLINGLPPELLSRIFELGSEDDAIEDEEDLADVLHNHLDAATAQENDIHDRDIDDIEQNQVEGDGGEDEQDVSDEDTSDEDESYDVFPPFALLVSHVCRHWRNVALSTPSLWTTIVVTPEIRPPYEPVSALLERSKGLPIDVTLNYDDLDEYEDDLEPPSDADLELLLAMLIPHIHRWRSIEVTVSEYHHMYAFLNAVSDPSVPAAPQLECLELYDYGDTESFETFQHPRMSKHLPLFAGSAPALTRIVLWGVHVDWDQPWIASASNLTDLELAYHTEDVRPSWTQFSTILRGASSLQKLSLRQSSPSGQPPGWFIESITEGSADVNSPIQLVRVTDFILAFQTQARAICLFRKIHLPALKHLVLDFDGGNGGDYTELVGELAKPTTSSSLVQEQPHSLLSRLESLKIAGLPCRADSCVKMLYGGLQNLKSLNLSMSYLDPWFLDILSDVSCSSPGHHSKWLPLLTTLYVSGACGSDLRQVVSRRKQAGIPLSSLYVEQDCDVDDNDVNWLKENIETLEFFEASDDEEDTTGFWDAGNWSDEE